MKTTQGAEKPPLGIMPKRLFYEKRFQDLCDAIVRYQLAKLEIPKEWLEERAEIHYKLNGIHLGCERCPSQPVVAPTSKIWFGSNYSIDYEQVVFIGKNPKDFKIVILLKSGETIDLNQNGTQEQFMAEYNLLMQKWHEKTNPGSINPVATDKEICTSQLVTNEPNSGPFPGVPKTFAPITAKCYIGAKVIRAEPTHEEDFLKEKGVYRKEEFNRGPGYKVYYPDGYVSWSPQIVFEQAYRELDATEKALVY